MQPRYASWTTAFVTLAAAAACSSAPGVSTEELAASEQATTGCSAVYGQCGGQGWTGATCCASGSSCSTISAYYWQCLPSSGGSSSGGSSSGGFSSGGFSSGGFSSGGFGGSSSSSSSSGASSQNANCPSGPNDAQERSAATVAFNVMKAAATACGGATDGPCWGTTILASQRYTIAAAGTAVASETWETIVFDPAHPGYSNVPQAAKAALAAAQADSDTAAFLVAGLRWALANTNGTLYPQVVPTAALMSFTYPGNSTPINIPDPNAGLNRRHDVVTGSPWCNAQKVHFVDSSYYESAVAPMKTQSMTIFESPHEPRFTGGNSWPTTPFNGSGGSNPYLVVAVNGTNINWNTSNWPTMDCSGIGDPTKCTGTIDIDPVPYAEPGAYYDTSGNLLGTQANPFVIAGSLYATPDHAGQWATRIVNGTQEWGTFSTPISILGVTLYKYVKQL